MNLNKLKSCPKKKDCKIQHIEVADNGDFICVGKRNRPKKYKFDKIGLCLKGKFSRLDIEMTKSECKDFMLSLLRVLI